MDLETVILFHKPGSFAHDLISNFVIVKYTCKIFVNYVFFNMYLFLMTYVLPIRYMIDWEYNFSPKNELAQNFCLFRWYVECTAKAAVARIPIYRPASSTYVYADYMYVQDSLLVYVFFIWLHLHVYYLGTQFFS